MPSSVDKSATICICTLFLKPSNFAKVSFKRSSSRPVIINDAPILAHSMAVALPIPEDAPVIRMTLPSKEKGLY